jgi:GNAT acetyltransferase-like protein
MVILERQIAGLLRYRKVWFPTHAAALAIGCGLRPNDLARFFGASDSLSALPHAVAHRQLRTTYVDLSGGPEEILKGMKKKSCRYEIRRAERMLGEVEIETGSSKAQRDFLALYNDFARAKRLPRFSPLQLREYSAHAQTLVLYFQGQPLCCHLLLRDRESSIVRLLYSGSRRLHTAEDAAACGALNRYLHWHELQRYHAQGFATFDFGGIRDADDPISRFKLSFGGAAIVEHYCLLSGTEWVARLGNLVYEKLRVGRAALKRTAPPSGAESSPSEALL